MTLLRLCTPAHPLNMGSLKARHCGMLALVLSLIAGSAQASTIGEVSDALYAPTEVLTELMVFMCYIVGVGMSLASLMYFKMHRQSPKLVPLTTPVFMLVLGIVLAFVPYLTNVFGDSFSASEEKKRRGGAGTSNIYIPELERKKPLKPGRKVDPNLPSPYGNNQR